MNAPLNATLSLCLWYDPAREGGAQAAARFYAETFPDSAVGAITLSPGDYPGGKAGEVLVVEFTLLGSACVGLNGGPGVEHGEAFSFQVATDTQEETDRYWEAIVGTGGSGIACGWCKDRWGVRWQIVPRVLTRGLADPDPGVRARTFAAMQTMVKIDIAGIEAAIKG